MLKFYGWCCVKCKPMMDFGQRVAHSFSALAIWLPASSGSLYRSHRRDLRDELTVELHTNNGASVDATHSYFQEVVS